MPQDEPSPASIRAWTSPPPGRVIGRGHVAGDFLEAYNWDLLEERPGLLRVSCQLPDHARNPAGQLFGGFTPTYVDMIALMTIRSGHRHEASSESRPWLATTNMRVDYFEPILGPTFVIESQLEKARGRTNFVVTRFFQDGDLAVHALTTIRAVAVDRTLRDA
jgi:acyl-coenzyme A thioesterase PaaI-like protein